MAADGGHLGNRWPYFNWSECLYSICITNWTVYMLKYITYSPNHLLTPRCHLRQNSYYTIADVGHVGNWRPYWNNMNIWSVFVTLTVQFACSKHTLCCQSNLFWPLNAIFEAKNNISQYPMAAILENGGHIGILRGPCFFLEKWPP